MDARIRMIVTTRPFRPSLVNLADGRQFEVRHPEYISRSTNGREVVVHEDDGFHRLEQPFVIELVLAERPASPRMSRIRSTTRPFFRTSHRERIDLSCQGGAALRI